MRMMKTREQCERNNGRSEYMNTEEKYIEYNAAVHRRKVNPGGGGTTSGDK